VINALIARLISAYDCGERGAFVYLARMFSGLTGASRPHSHFFRDFQRATKVDTSTHDGDPSRGTATGNPTTEVDNLDSESDGNDEMIKKLEERNQDVIAHEAAHMAAGGAYIKGGATYTYQIGPDGKPYAIGGQVGVDVTPVPGDPRATINKMMAIRSAALSPDDPSSQDMSVASTAAEIEEQARAQLNAEESQAATPVQHAAVEIYKPAKASRGAFVNANA
jgi:hypothetical protein